jgi:histidinol phosphatase-like enzyme (inositol monophosphatase family)
VVSNSEYLDFALDAAWQAGRLTLAHFQTGIAVDRKADDTPVTLADRGAEQLLRQLIAARFPSHAVVGEEFGADERDSDHRWIIDPIDGTQSFIRGVPLYGVLLGLEIAGEMVAGVVHLPALGEIAGAARGTGCRWNGRAARVSDTRHLSDALLAYTDLGTLHHHPAGIWPRLEQATRLRRGWSDCYGYVLVATGRAEIMLDAEVKPWDCAPLLPLLEEAGGRFTDWNGVARIDGGNAVATNGRLHAAVLDILQSRS